MKNLVILSSLFFVSSISGFSQKSVFVNSWIESSPDTIANYDIKKCNCELSIARYVDQFQEPYPVYLDLKLNEIFYLNNRYDQISDRIVHDRIKITQ